MNPLDAILREAIRRDGPLRFDHFMHTALYHAELGYYRRRRDPFGIHGDFFTAAQMQPEFGDLIGHFIERLIPGRPPSAIRVVDLGAGRREMAPALARFAYRAVDAGDALPPADIVFANEFFDALPVRAGVMLGTEPHELLVAAGDGGFAWVNGPALDADAGNYLERYWSPREPGQRFEIAEQARGWVARIAESIEDGWLIAIDYGYTRAETVRFPGGSLMSYQRHAAFDDVLQSPGERDITAHVSFDALRQDAVDAGFDNIELRTLGAVLLDCVEQSDYLRRASPVSRQRIKTLLFGMGETFRVLLAGKKKAPTNRGHR